MTDATLLERYEPVIGLEVHVQLRTASKMFCRCPVRFGEPPNTLVCPVCTGQPGTLPVLNAEALRLGILAGLALGCQVDPVTKFDRKNYFYPDLPKGYQISQYDQPLCRDGRLVFRRPDGSPGEVSLTRAHLEEDTGKIIHPAGMDISLVDFNRAGTPLLEIVSGPDLRCPEDAVAFLKDLQQTLRYAGVSDCDMEKGSFRCDANISLRPRGSSTLGTRTEAKNLNSFRFVAGALSAEIRRQASVLDAGGSVEQLTLAYDPNTGETSSTRGKEAVEEYRYFPEPDLPAFAVDPAWVERLRAQLPEAPVARHRRMLEQMGLRPDEAAMLLADRALADYFEATAAASGQPREAAKWVLTEARRLCNERRVGVDELRTTPERLGGLVRLVARGGVSVQAGRQLASALEEQPDRTAEELARELDLEQVSDAGELEQLVGRVLEQEAELVRKYREGKGEVLHALLGCVMKASRGKANPNAARELLRRLLDA